MGCAPASLYIYRCIYIFITHTHTHTHTPAGRGQRARPQATAPASPACAPAPARAPPSPRRLHPQRTARARRSRGVGGRTGAALSRRPACRTGGRARAAGHGAPAAALGTGCGRTSRPRARLAGAMTLCSWVSGHQAAPPAAPRGTGRRCCHARAPDGGARASRATTPPRADLRRAPRVCACGRRARDRRSTAGGCLRRGGAGCAARGSRGAAAAESHKGGAVQAVGRLRRTW